MLAQQVNRKGEMMQICLDLAGVYCGEIFQAIMKNCAQGLVWWEQRSCKVAVVKQHFQGSSPGTQPKCPWCQKLPCTAQVLRASPLMECLRCRWGWLGSGGPWAGQELHGSPGAAHAVHGPAAHSCPGAACQALMAP